MELEQHEWDKSEVYLSSFDTLIGDKRTRSALTGVIHGIIAGESLRLSRNCTFFPPK